MLQSMRDRAKSWVTIIVVAIIAFMMAITGLESLAPNPNNPTVASVNGQDITRAQLLQSLEQQRRMLMQQIGEQFDPSMIDEGVFRKAVLQSLVDRALQLQDAQKQGMNIGQEALDRMIVSMPEFQQDGRFDQTRFQMLLRNFGMTPLQFRQMLKEENLLLQLRSGLSASEFVTDGELQNLSALENQTRDMAWLVLESAPVREAITPSEEEIQNYYDSNKDSFMTPEEVVVNYIELSKAVLADATRVTDEAISEEYQKRIDTLKANKGRPKVASILVATGKKRSLEEARQRADEVLAQLAQGKAFAELAKDYSDDPVTAAKGGDMGSVEPGFFGEAFDQAVASLKVGEVSQPVATDYGLQIIKLTAASQEVKIPTLQELRENIVNSLRRRMVEERFLERSRQLADISFEAADLNQPAEVLDLAIKSSAAFGRNGGEGIANNPKVVEAAFSDDVLNMGANSEVIELSPDTVIVLRIKEHRQPELIPLEKVREQVTAVLKKQKALVQLQEKASQLVASLGAEGADIQAIAREAGLKWQEGKAVSRGQAGINRQLLAKAFKMPHPDADRPVLDYAELPNGDVAVIALSAVYPGAYSSEDRKKMQGMIQYIANSKGRNIYSEYLQSLKNRGSVKINLTDE